LANCLIFPINIEEFPKNCSFQKYRVCQVTMNKIVLLVFFLQNVLAQEEIYLLQDNCLLCVEKYSSLWNEDVVCCHPNLRADKAIWIRKKQSDGRYLLQNKRNKEYLNSDIDFLLEVFLGTSGGTYGEDVYWEFHVQDQGWHIENRNHADSERYLNKDDLKRRAGLWKIGQMVNGGLQWDEGRASITKPTTKTTTKRTTTKSTTQKTTTKKPTTRRTTKKTTEKMTTTTIKMTEPITLEEIYLLQDNCLLCIKKYTIFWGLDVVCCLLNEATKPQSQWIRKKQSNGTYLLQNKGNKEHLSREILQGTNRHVLDFTNNLQNQNLDVYWEFEIQDNGWHIQNTDHGDIYPYLNMDDLEKDAGLWKIGRMIGGKIQWDEGRASVTKPTTKVTTTSVTETTQTSTPILSTVKPSTDSPDKGNLVSTVGPSKSPYDEPVIIVIILPPD
jgi:hypothetical protein